MRQIRTNASLEKADKENYYEKKIEDNRQVVLPIRLIPSYILCVSKML